MPTTPSRTDADTAASLALALCDVGREFAGLGLLPATSGNLSVRLAERTVLMTRSGRDKGALVPDDLMRANIDQAPPPGASAEAPLHLALYRMRADIACVLHVHSRAAAVLSRACAAEGALILQGWELQKALAGQHSHEQALRLPIFPNAQDTVALAEQVAQGLGEAQVPAYLLAGHGLYAWGRDLGEARRHVQALDVLLQSELDLRSLR